MSSNPYNIDVYNAEQAIYALNDQVRDRVKEAEKKIRKEMHESFDAARSALRAAEKRRDAQQIIIDNEEVAKAAADDRIGRIYVQWGSPFKYSSQIKPTGKRGICEVFTAEMRETCTNRNRHTEPGHLIIRHLKKSGERAKTLDTFTRRFSDDEQNPPWGWHLEGESPK